MALARGFPSYAEQLAEDARRELGLSVFDRLNPGLLAADLEIPLRPLSSLRAIADTAADKSAIDVLAQQDSTALSAMTVFRGLERVIVYNDSHPRTRQANSICHELAHGLLLHTPSVALDDRGCRDWDQDAEDEADYLGGALLVPGKAARGAITRGWEADEVASRYGCSAKLAAWRLNTSMRRTRRTAVTARRGTRAGATRRS